MTRWILSLGTLACLVSVGACNGELANVSSEGSDGGTVWGEGVPAGEDASTGEPTADASAGYDSGVITPDDASIGDDDAAVDPDGSCPPPPPPPPPCGCPVADASPPDDAEAPAP